MGREKLQEGQRLRKPHRQRRSHCQACRAAESATVHGNFVNRFERWVVCLFNQEVDLCLIPRAPVQSAVSLGGAPAQGPGCCRRIYVRGGWPCSHAHKSEACQEPRFGLAHLGTVAAAPSPSHLPVGLDVTKSEARARRRGCWVLCVHSFI